MWQLRYVDDGAGECAWKHVDGVVGRFGGVTCSIGIVSNGFGIGIIKCVGIGVAVASDGSDIDG